MASSLRITYVGKHDSGGNDDEGAVAHALRVLGHEVTCVLVQDRQRAHPFPPGDMLLFNKCNDWEVIKAFEGHRVLWYWDRVVEPGDSTLVRRNEARRSYVERAMEAATLSFFTDGDWSFGCNLKHEMDTVKVPADVDKPLKAHWLPQGFDERQMFPDLRPEKRIPILFTGSTRGCGLGRLKWFQAMQERWGSDFYHVEHGVHGERLAMLIRQAKVVVAPDAPVSDRYWSNRVYGVLGMGGFLIHPRSKGLYQQYNPLELIGYGGLPDTDAISELHEYVEFYLNSPSSRDELAALAHKTTMQHHLYRHRCEGLIEEVRKL